MSAHQQVPVVCLASAAVRWSLALAGALSTAGPAAAAEIVLEQGAVQKLVVHALFKDNERFYVKKGACSAYLETPTVTLAEGRVVIRSHLSGRFGVEVSGHCLGVGLASWTVVSGLPSAQGAVVRLEGIRIDEVDDPNTRQLLNLGLVPSLPHAVELDVLKAVRAMFQGAGGQIQADVQALNIEAVGATDNKLSVRFDFKLVGR